MDIKRLFIISGPASVGKTTVSRILAHHLPEKTAIVDGDDILRFSIVNGNISDFFLINAKSVINNFLKSGVDVVFSHYVLPDEIVELAKDLDQEEVKVVYLTANLRTLKLRNQTRPTDGQTHLDLELELEKFNNANIDPKYILDNSELTLTETAKTIMNEDRFIVK
ncbi:MAG: hypothetical protein ACOX56_02485 [Acholeplasmataceae bacterium]